MKKRIGLILVFIFLSIEAFNMLYAKENNIQYEKMMSIGQTKDSIQILISSEQYKDNELYNKVKHYLDKYKANIYCSQIIKESNKSKTIKYMYITNMNVFKDVHLEDGRFFDLDENESDKFISTKNTNDENQIGKLATFTQTSKSPDFELRTLKKGLNQDIFNRNLSLELDNTDDLDSFIQELHLEDIYVEVRESNIPSNNPEIIFIMLAFVCFFVLIMLIFYDLLNSYKKIAIEKMLGYNNTYIWLKRLFPIIIIELISMIIAIIIMYLFRVRTFNIVSIGFITKLVKVCSIVVLCTFLFLSIPFLYINTINISNMLKNKRPVKEIIYFNTIIKIILSTILIIITAKNITTFKLVFFSFEDNFQKWEQTKQYFVISNHKCSNNKSKEDIYSQENKGIEKKLFMKFNKEGAIYSDYDDFTSESLNYNYDFYTRNARVNPNYLKQNPIYDENNKRIYCNESDQSYILLVPEKYHNYEKEIIEYHKLNQSSSLPDQKIKIIWTKSNQKLFTYNLFVKANDNNMVTDPIIKVVTESNGDSLDYFVIISYNGDPFKIKSNSIDCKQDILEELGKYYDLTLNEFRITSVYDSVQDQINQRKKIMNFLIGVILMLVFIICLVIIQNTYNFFKQNRMRLAIQQFHGYTRIDKYKSYYFNIFFTWTISLSFSCVFVKDKLLIPLIICVMIIEIGVSSIIIKLLEKDNILQVTKGG